MIEPAKDIDGYAQVEVRAQLDAHEVSIEVTGEENSAALEPAAARRLAQMLVEAADLLDIAEGYSTGGTK